MKSAFSLSFLRPIYHALEKTTSRIVIIRVLYSGMAGSTDVFAFETWSHLKTVLRSLPSQSIIQWYDLDITNQDWRMNPQACIPMEDGSVVTGAY